jgi:hypothetical protein
MNISVHIERLILDGLTIPPSRHGLLQAAIAAELSRSLAAGGLAPGLLSGGAVSDVRGGNVQLTGQASPSDLGRQIARAVYGGIGKWIDRQ